MLDYNASKFAVRHRPTDPARQAAHQLGPHALSRAALTVPC